MRANTLRDRASSALWPIPTTRRSSPRPIGRELWRDHRVVPRPERHERAARRIEAARGERREPPAARPQLRKTRARGTATRARCRGAACRSSARARSLRRSVPAQVGARRRAPPMLWRDDHRLRRAGDGEHRVELSRELLGEDLDRGERRTVGNTGDAVDAARRQETRKPARTRRRCTAPREPAGRESRSRRRCDRERACGRASFAARPRRACGTPATRGAACHAGRSAPRAVAASGRSMPARNSIAVIVAIPAK